MKEDWYHEGSGIYGQYKGIQGKAGERRGTAVKRVVEQVGFDVKAGVLPEDRTVVEAVLRQLADTGSVQLILTVGSTGVLKKNCAPDALTDAAERLLPGIPEAIRAYSIRYSKKSYWTGRQPVSATGRSW